MAAQLTREVQLVNKRVVILSDVDAFYHAVGSRNGLFVMASATSPSLLLAPGPSGLSARDIEDVFRDMRRIAGDLLAPSVLDAV
jgi:hypothetical protein